MALAGLTIAGPRMQIGTKATWRPDMGYSTWYDTSGTPVASVSYGEQFIGPTIEAVYGPFWGLSGRVDITQYSIYLKGGGAFRLFPMLGLDVMFEPPLDWRAKPYVWAGARLTGGESYSPETPPTFIHDSESHWRAGLGAKFKLTRMVELFAETQWYANDRWWDGVSVFPDGSYLAGCSGTEVIGLTGAELGARFALSR
jgi:hypothetical protein